MAPVDPLDLPVAPNRYWPEAAQILETHGQQVRAAIADLESRSGTSELAPTSTPGVFKVVPRS